MSDETPDPDFPTPGETKLAYRALYIGNVDGAPAFHRLSDEFIETACKFWPSSTLYDHLGNNQKVVDVWWWHHYIELHGDKLTSLDRLALQIVLAEKSL